MLHRNKRGIALCFLTLFLFLSGCGSLKDDTLLIVNAVITKVDTGKQTIMVKDDADESTLGEDCLIDCSSIPMVYCDFATQKVTRISFEDLQVNDKQRWTRGYKRYKETSGLIEWKECQIFHSIFT